MKSPGWQFWTWDDPFPRLPRETLPHAGSATSSYQEGQVFEPLPAPQADMICMCDWGYSHPTEAQTYGTSFPVLPAWATGFTMALGSPQLEAEASNPKLCLHGNG